MPEPGSGGLEVQTFAGSDLLHAFQSAGRVDLLPEQAAIYLWKIRVMPNVARRDGQGLINHIERIAKLPQGRLRNVPLGRGLTIEEFLIGGTGLNERKRADFIELVRTANGATFVWKYLMFLQSQVPAIYVGETGDLPRRIREHIEGSTDFGRTVNSDPVLTWDDLILEVVRMGDVGDDGVPSRRALEYLATLMTISSYTQRPG